MEENKRGGIRKNSGRKPISDPKKAITLYVAKSKILLHGGEDKLRLKVYDVISKDFQLAQPVLLTTINSNAVSDTVFIEPEVRKSVEMWIAEKREIQIPELYEEFIDRLNKTKTLTDQQKKLVRYA